MAETWRVVLASGEVREVRVEPCVVFGALAPISGFRGWRAVRVGSGAGLGSASEAMGDSAEEACARLAVGNGLAVREILAPGEITRAEILAGVEAYAAQLAPMTRAVDALRAAAVAAGHPAADGDPDAQLCAVRAAAWSAGAEAMRAELADHHTASVLPRETALRETAEALGFTHMGAQGFAGMARRQRDAAIAAEREACAVICDALGDAAEVERDACCDDRSRSLHAGRMHGADECARAIRARGAGGGA